ncbi:hypothetical protein Cgig2_002189 [Carnegiea gigantea]|uniref:Uncharacterized protein n=1 Tax=Carnegiea gigantea TaxID=171969 RepID=A0A9Q1KX40_9CARY|nr:hypothetical protein Cgig2_002189 [Carnegiea gigantea]
MYVRFFPSLLASERSKFKSIRAPEGVVHGVHLNILTSRCSGFVQEDDSLFLEAVGGWSEKGTFYGVGNSVGLSYEKPSNNATANKSSYTPSTVAQLQTELDSMKTELNSTKNEIRQHCPSMEEQQRKMKQQQRQIEEQQRKRSRNKGWRCRNE